MYPSMFRLSAITSHPSLCRIQQQKPLVARLRHPRFLLRDKKADERVADDVPMRKR